MPSVCHVHYRRIAPIVEDLAEKHGIRYSANRTFLLALRSHARWLKQMGQPPVAVA